MTHRTRLTVSGLKTRFRKKREKKAGPITRIVGNTPMKTRTQAALETAQAEWNTLSDLERQLLMADIVEEFGEKRLKKAVAKIATWHRHAGGYRKYGLARWDIQFTGPNNNGHWMLTSSGPFQCRLFRTVQGAMRHADEREK